jgi:hypothetical protein
MINPIFAFMGAASLLAAIFGPWWLTIIGLWAAYQYFKMSVE